jgi:4-amino-4-deoxy-L-arabinose transferase-like glycosyltransferase
MTVLCQLRKLATKRSSFSARRNVIKSLPTKAIILIVIAFQISIGFFYSLYIPPFVPSDERSHLETIFNMATYGHLHVLQFLDRSYEAMQPPVYHCLAAFIMNGLLRAKINGWIVFAVLRMFGVCLYTLSIIVFYFTLRILLPDHRLLRLSSLASYALAPCMVAICATVTNDSLSFLMASIGAYLIASANKNGWTKRRTIVLGILNGAALLTKLAYAPFVIVGAVFLLAHSRKQKLNQIVVQLLLFALPTVLILSPWLLWNYSNYHALTGISMLYGAGLNYFWHPQVMALNKQTIYDLCSSWLAYQYLPSEFWNEYFRVHTVVKFLIISVTFLGFVGAARYFFSKVEEIRIYVVTLGSFYLTAFLFWLTFSITFYPEPFRGFLGAYIGFIAVQVSGLTSISNNRKVLYALPPLFMLGLNMYLIWIIFLRLTR